jgi:hypothetical protein
MIPDVNIRVGRLPLGFDKQLALAMLVKRYPFYKRQPGRWPDLAGKIASVSGMPGSLNVIAGGDPNTPTTPTTPTMDDVKGMALDAILTALRGLPGVVVEDEGTDKEKVFLSTAQNWEELAQGVLDILYETTGGRQIFLLVQRTLWDYGYRPCGPGDELRDDVIRFPGSYPVPSNRW